MVQVIGSGRVKQPSFLQSIVGGAAANVPSAIEKYQGMKQQQLAMQQENESVKRMGINLSGINDPKMRQEALSYALQGKNQQELEQTRQQGKQGRLDQTQDYLSKLFGGQQGQGAQNGQQQRQESQQGMTSGFDPSQLTDEDIAIASSMDPNLGRTLSHQKDVALRENREERNFTEKQKNRKEDILNHKNELQRKEEFEITKPLFAELNQTRKNIPLQEQAIEDIINTSPKVSALDYFADVTGFEPLRSAEGAKLKTGIKDFFLSDLTRVGARPNQWIEQQLSDALPKIGRSPEANLITAEGLKFKVDLAKKRMELIDELSEQDREKYGFARANIDSRASKEMKKYVIDRQKEMKENIEKIKALNKGKKNVVKMRSPDGSIYEISTDDIDEARENDFEFTE